MKKVKNKIKNSIKLPDLSFYEKLPKIEKQRKTHYVLAFPSILIMIVLLLPSITKHSEIIEDNIGDNVIFNTLNINNTFDNKMNLELNYGYKKIDTTIENINTYYKTNINVNNLISSNYVVLNDEKNTICYASVDYKINNKDINVKIADELGTWNIETYGFINNLYNSDKSILENKQIMLAKYNNNDYPKYIMYEYENNIIYYHALYQKDNLYYYVTTNDLIEEEFILFLKEYVI